MTLRDIMKTWSYKSPVYITTSIQSPAGYEDCSLALIKPPCFWPEEVKELHVTEDGKFIVTID